MMPKTLLPTLLAGLAAGMLGACSPADTSRAEVTRYPIPGSDFPIANAVEVPAGLGLVFVSGKTPAPANPDAEKFSADYWGDTQAQTLSALTRIDETLKSLGLGMGDVIKMQAFIVGDPAKNGVMDFEGFMAGYTQFFGGETQPNLPARTTVQVAGLAAPGMLVEIDVIAVRP